MITVHAQIEAGELNRQRDAKLKPGKLLDLSVDKVEDFYSKYHEDVYHLVRNDFIKKRMDDLVKKPVNVGAMVDEKNKFESMKFCLRCNYENDPSFLVCHVCRSKELGKKEFSVETTGAATTFGHFF